MFVHWVILLIERLNEEKGGQMQTMTGITGNRVADIDYRVLCLREDRDFFSEIGDNQQVSLIDRELTVLQSERVERLTRLGIVN